MKDYEYYTGSITTRSGREYPDFALGTYLRTEDEMVNLLREYSYDKLMLDTAYKYGNEHVVDSSIRKSGYPKKQIIFIGKINTEQQERNKIIREEFMNTLHRLRIHKINIYLIHSNRSPYYCETWSEMIKFQREGLIDTIGVSNFEIEDIEKLYKSTGIYPEINQIVMPFSDVGNDESGVQNLIQYCKNKKIIVQVAMPFGGSRANRGLTLQQRQEILKQLRQQKLTCVFGTSSIKHLYQNISWVESGR